MEQNKLKLDKVNRIYITIWHEDTGKCKIFYDDTFNNDEQYIINSLRVTKTLRKHGIGTSLIKLAEDIIRKLGSKYAYLYVLKENVWIHKWYERLGYFDTNEECEDGYFKMRKEL